MFEFFGGFFVFFDKSGSESDLDFLVKSVLERENLDLPDLNKDEGLPRAFGAQKKKSLAKKKK